MSGFLDQSSRVKIEASALPALPNDAKRLICEGHHSLYTSKQPGIAYLLLTKSGEQYFLDAYGNYLWRERLEDPMSIVDRPVSLSEHVPWWALGGL